MPRAVKPCSKAACTPAGTSTEFFRYGTVAATSSDPQLTDSRLRRVWGAAKG